MRDLVTRKSQESWRWNKSDVFFLILLLLPSSLGSPENNNTKNSAQSEGQGPQNKNPMALYIGSPEGVSLTHEDGGQTFFSYFSEENYLGSHVTDFKSLAAKRYTRILVGPNKTENVYPLTFSTYLINTTLIKTTIEMRVHRNSDGSVSLSCESNKKFMTWGESPSLRDGKEKSMSTDFPEKQVALSTNLGGAEVPLCVEEGICPTCRYNLVVGSIMDITLNILNVTFKAPEGWEPSEPGQVSETSIVNHANEPIDSTLSVDYSYETIDETIWENAWGFEESSTWNVGGELKIPKTPLSISGGYSETSKISYNGKNGKTNTIKESQNFQDSLTVSCPARTKCYLKYTAEKIDNIKVPFTALVEKSTDTGAMEQFEQNGTWKGVNTLNFHKIFCTENLDTGYSNCPMGMGDGTSTGGETGGNYLLHSLSFSGGAGLTLIIGLVFFFIKRRTKCSRREKVQQNEEF